ncbi:MAG: hypothetical protein L6R38_006838 [Xanthoria sp. 2 TBL-2021]|nr:MAG: hypothetical protein L6R38_006838 [Xanthoria sp. 2 TBL-2021]
MASFLCLTINMPETKTYEIASDKKLTVDVDVKSSKETPPLSFTTVPTTPPHTPPDDGTSSEIPGKALSPEISLESTTQLEGKSDEDLPTASTNNSETQSKTHDTLPIPTPQVHDGTKDEVVTAAADAHELQSKAEPEDALQNPTIQIEDKSDCAAIQDPINGYQDTIATSPTITNAPQAAYSLNPATRLKFKLQHTTDLIVCPGVYDGLSARIAEAVGFETLYMTGAGSTASMLGMADLGIASRDDMVRNADMIANLNSHNFELIADMDTGYGGPVTITQTVKQYIRANVAAFHIEDQVLTKRCGHLSGKKVVTNDVYLSRIRAARAAIDHEHADIQLIARTDANQQLGYDECMVRLKAARDCGADVGLLEGFKTKEEAARAVKELAPWPLLLNIVENGHSPLITVEEAREMGFRIMIFSFAGLAPAYMAMKAAYEKLRYEGITGIQGSGVGPRVLFDVCGLQDAVEVDANAGGEDYKGMI